MPKAEHEPLPRKIIVIKRALQGAESGAEEGPHRSNSTSLPLGSFACASGCPAKNVFNDHWSIDCGLKSFLGSSEASEEEEDEWGA